MRLIVFFLLAVLTTGIMSCGQGEPQERSASEQPQTGADGLLVSEPETKPFSRQLSFPGGYNLKVSSRVEADHHEFRIDGTIKGQKLRQPIKGSVPVVTGADIADINNDGQPEVYLYARIPGVNNYGKVFGFNFTPTGFWSQIEVQNLREDMMRGYQGEDTFMVQNGQLFRSFPIYLSSDETGEPSGGSRKIIYHLVPGDSTLALQPRGAM